MTVVILLVYDNYLVFIIVSFHLQTLAAARMLTASGPGGQTHWGDSTANNSASGTQSADAQLKVLILNIFDMLKMHDKPCDSVFIQHHLIENMTN